MKFTRKAREEAKAVRKGKGLREAADAHNKRVAADEVRKKREARERRQRGN